MNKDDEAHRRFAKLKNHEFSWWMTTLETILPMAKEKLTMFKDVAMSLKISGDLQGVEPVEIELDERWITKKRSILLHTMEDIDMVIHTTTNQPTVTMRFDKRKDFPTVGNTIEPRKRQKSLGMLSLRRT